MDMQEDLSAVDKPAKTRRQMKAAVGHSRKYRADRKAAGLPTGRQIDHALLVFLLKSIKEGNGFVLKADMLPPLRDRAIRFAGWDADNERTMEAADKRVAKLVAIKRKR